MAPLQPSMRRDHFNLAKYLGFCLYQTNRYKGANSHKRAHRILDRGY